MGDSKYPTEENGNWANENTFIILLQDFRKDLNRFLNFEPIILILVSVLLTHFAHKLFQHLRRYEATGGIKRQLFKIVRKFPILKQKIAAELSTVEKSLDENISGLYTGKNGYRRFMNVLPGEGLKPDEIMKTMDQYMDLGSITSELSSGALYHNGEELKMLNTKVFALSQSANPLHHAVFPGICKMEAEVVKMSAAIFGGNQETCGTLTSGGTESLLLAVKAYRDWAMDERGINLPEILVPTTAHAAFDKAAHFLGIRIKKVPINSSTCKVDVGAMQKMINGKTCMLVGSAPAFPHGCVDDIEKIGQLGLKYKIPVHVDACLGGFLLAFMPAAGFSIEPFDFKVPGVTSISADTHKYGFTTKGSSVLLFSEKKYRRYQYFSETNWPGGLYASATMAGSRPGSLIAGCWATFLYFGLNGYVESTKKILETSRYILEKTKQIPEICVMGDPKASVVAWRSDKFDIFRLYEAMSKLGWGLHALQFPSSIHVVVAYPQTKAGVAEKFVKDMKNSVAEIMKTPTSAPSGTAAIYGTSQQVPVRSLVNEIMSVYLDKLYETDFK